jgi:zinc/manganese transport system permease protein
MAAAALVGTAATSLGILLAYDSYYWPPHGHGWSVSFFVVTLVVLGYLLSYVRRPRRDRGSQVAAQAREEEPACSPA